MQIKLIPRRAIQTGSVIIRIPQTSFSLVRVMKVLAESLKDGLMSTPVLHVFDTPRLTIKGGALPPNEKEDAGLRTDVEVDPKHQPPELQKSTESSKVVRNCATVQQCNRATVQQCSRAAVHRAPTVYETVGPTARERLSSACSACATAVLV
jgi:hypothetical protein